MQSIENCNGPEQIDLVSRRVLVHHLQPLPYFMEGLMGSFELLLGQLCQSPLAAIHVEELLYMNHQSMSFHSLCDISRELLHDLVMQSGELVNKALPVFMQSEAKHIVINFLERPQQISKWLQLIGKNILKFLDTI